MNTSTKIFELKKELSFLYRVAQSVHSLEIDELLKEIVKITSEVTKGDSCLIYIYDSKKKELVLRASKNPHRNLLQKLTMKLGEGITGWVAKEMQSVVIDRGAYKDSRFKLFSNLPEDKFEAFLSVPIINKKGIAGVINIQFKKEHKHTITELNLLTAIGKLVGGAIENALLIEESLVLKEALETRKIIEKAKGLLMNKRKITEDEAFRIIQKESMNSRKSLREISEAIMIAQNIKMGY